MFLGHSNSPVSNRLASLGWFIFSHRSSTCVLFCFDFAFFTGRTLMHSREAQSQRSSKDRRPDAFSEANTTKNHLMAKRLATNSAVTISSPQRPTNGTNLGIDKVNADRWNLNRTWSKCIQVSSPTNFSLCSRRWAWNSLSFYFRPPCQSWKKKTWPPVPTKRPRTSADEVRSNIWNEAWRR